jgi:hypothetical protein
MAEDETSAGAKLSDEVEKLIERMDPDNKVRAAIRKHLLAQHGVPQGHVKLDTGHIVSIGEDGDGDA